MHWIVLYTKADAEARVARALHDRGIEVFLPTARQRHRGRWGEWPFFPCYLFARVDFQRVGYSTLAWTPGLRRVVTFASKPAVMPDEAIEAIRQRLLEINGRGGLPSHSLRPGDAVRFKAGPLRGLQAVFEGPMKPAERVRVLIQFLGRENQVEVPVADLEPVLDVEGKSKRARRTRGHGRRIAASR